MFRTLAFLGACSFATAAPNGGVSAAPSSAALPAVRHVFSPCTATISLLSFSTFSQVTQAGRSAESYVTFDCPAGVARIELSAGNSGQFAVRTMLARGDRHKAISYNIYLDVEHTQIFGDGGGGSSAYVPASGVSRGSFPVYATIEDGQRNLPLAHYSDTLSITIRPAG